MNRVERKPDARLLEPVEDDDGNQHHGEREEVINPRIAEVDQADARQLKLGRGDAGEPARAAVGS